MCRLLLCQLVQLLLYISLRYLIIQECWTAMFVFHNQLVPTSNIKLWQIPFNLLTSHQLLNINNTEEYKYKIEIAVLQYMEIVNKVESAYSFLLGRRDPTIYSVANFQGSSQLLFKIMRSNSLCLVCKNIHYKKYQKIYFQHLNFVDLLRHDTPTRIRTCNYCSEDSSLSLLLH